MAALVPAAAAAGPNVVPRPLCCIPNGPVNAVALDGNVAYVGGEFRHVGYPHHHLAVISPATGQPDDGWPGVDGGYVKTSAPDGQGGWFVGGSFTSIGGVARQGLAHIRADKTVDPDWAPSTNGSVNALVRDGGVIYVGGSFGQVNGGTARANVAAFDETTGAVTGFTADTNGEVKALASSFRFTDFTFMVSVRRLYIGGAFDMVDGQARHHLAVVNLADGNLVGSDPGLDDTVFALAVGYTGGFKFNPAVIFAGGQFANAGATPRGRGAEFDEDGVNLQPWNPGADNQITALALGSSTVYIGGRFTHVGGAAHNYVAATQRSDGAVVAGFTASLEWPSSVIHPFVSSLVLTGGDLYVGGHFLSVNNGIPRSDLAAFDGATGAVTDWDPDPPGLNAAIQHLNFDGASMITSGEFGTIGGPARGNLAAFDLSTGQLLPFDPDVTNAPADTSITGVDALAVQGATLYVGGHFGRAGGGTVTRSNAAAFDTATGQPTPFDPSPDGDVSTIAPYGGTVFLGGDFGTVDNSVADRVGLAEVDAQTGAVTPFRQDTDSRVYSLLVDSGTLYVAGTFNTLGGANRHGFGSVRLVEGGTGTVTAFDPAFDGYVGSLALRGSTLYFGGGFTHVLSGIPRQGLAAFDTGTTLLAPWDPATDSGPTSMATDPQYLFAAGSFTQLSGLARPGVGAIGLAGGLATDWNPPVPSGAIPNAVATSPTGGLLVGGDAVFAQGMGLLQAYALPPAAPPAPQASAGAGQATVGFSAPANGGAPITSYRVVASPGGQSATGSGSPIAVTGLTPGTSYTFTLTATNAAGDGPASPPSNAVTPSAAPGGAGAGPGGAAGAQALTASAFKVTHKRFKVAAGATPLVARTPKGTTFVFRLSGDATSRIAIARALPGRKQGRRCVAPRKGLKKRCTRYQKLGTLVRKRTKAGANKVPFSGRLGRRALRPGTYRATLVATNAAGRRSKPLSLSFKVVKR